MVSANTLCKKLLNVKNAVVEDAEFYSDNDGVNHIRIHARPNAWHIYDCPFCHERCRRYDKKNSQPRTWRIYLSNGGTVKGAIAKFSVTAELANAFLFYTLSVSTIFLSALYY